MADDADGVDVRMDDGVDGRMDDGVDGYMVVWMNIWWCG